MSQNLGLFYLSRQNIRRKLFRSLVTIIAVAIVATIIFPATILGRGVNQSLSQGTARLGADLMVVPPGYTQRLAATLISGEPTSFVMDGSVQPLVAQVAGVEKVSPQIYFATLASGWCTGSLQVVGIDPETDFTVGPWITGGTTKSLLDNQVILGANAHIFLGKSESFVGDMERFYGREFTVTGIMEPTGIGLDDAGFVTINTVYDMARFPEPEAVRKLDFQPGQISALMVKVDRDYSRSDVAVRIEQQVPGVRVVTSRELMSSSVARQLESLTPGLILVGIGFWVISVLMIGALFSMIVNERRRELGLLQAMGATKRYIFRLVMLESVELTSVGGVLGLIIGGVSVLVLTGPVASSLGIAYIWPGAAFVSVFILLFMLMAALTGVIAALYPAVVASRLEPYQAIRTGE